MVQNSEAMEWLFTRTSSVLHTPTIACEWNLCCLKVMCAFVWGESVAVDVAEIIDFFLNQK